MRIVGGRRADRRQRLVQHPALLMVDHRVAVAVQEQVRRGARVDAVARARRAGEPGVVVDPVQPEQRRGRRGRQDLALERVAPAGEQEVAPREVRHDGADGARHADVVARRRPRAAASPVVSAVERREVPACRRAADRDAVGIEAVLGRVRAQPPHRGLHVVHRRRVGHRRDEPVVRARDGEAVGDERHEALDGGVGLVAQRPCPAVEVQQRRQRRRRARRRVEVQAQ